MTDAVRRRIVVALVALPFAWGVPASAQPPVRSLVDLQGRLAVGDTVTITDTAGRETVGRLSELSVTTLRLEAGRSVRSFSAGDIQRVQHRRPDSWVNGLLIGAAAGAGYGLYWYFKDPNECGNTICGSDLAIGMLVGGAVGMGIDAAIKKNVVVYLAPATARSFRAGITVRW